MTSRVQAVSILLVEDDSDVLEALVVALNSCGYEVRAVACGNAALAAVDTRSYTLALVDVSLPDINGLSVIRRWRRAGHTFPVVVITALPDGDTRTAALEAGANDYLTKPFSLTELEERIAGLLRRDEPGRPSHAIRVGRLVVTPGSPQILICDRQESVSPQELALLEVLVGQVGRVISTASLATRLARGSMPLTEAGVASHVHQLRARLAESGVRIRKLRGFGYLLELEAAATPGP
jgi:DNA-binding response OmpR family regulator